MTALGDITTVLRDADPADKAEVYRQLGRRMNTSLERKRCALQSISARTMGQWFVPEGQHDPLPHRR
ncbi:hypothetical protein [Micromonospora sp. NPDC048843]|uniref:hypothetical protein n=1 Tax=Micromonospora sp. NPDC048843 TaxID=3155389 RepID=UPI0033FDBE0D